jgi:hypothetical protein
MGEFVQGRVRAAVTWAMTAVLVVLALALAVSGALAPPTS